MIDNSSTEIRVEDASFVILEVEGVSLNSNGGWAGSDGSLELND